MIHKGLLKTGSTQSNLFNTINKLPPIVTPATAVSQNKRFGGQ
jgi:hypothetical protein